jgi:hemerythrin-like domain-containing protein
MLTTQQAGPDLTGFLVAHAVMKAEYGRLADVAADLDGADRARTAAVEAHLDFMLRYLQHHHEPEDHQIWPALREAAPEAVPVLDRLEADHGDLDLLVEQVGDRGRTLAQRAPILREMQARLAAHLELEEREAVPLIRRHLSAQWWGAMDEAYMRTWDKPDLPFLFGMGLRYATPAQAAHLLGTVPWFVRVLWRVAMRPGFERRMRLVYGS